MTETRTWPGKPYPLGATWDGQGTNFSIYSDNAEKVELCLFDGECGDHETARIPLTEFTNQVWHIYLPGVGPGQLYGYRVSGPYDPGQGLRFNPNKLLLDPYAKAINGTLDWDDALFGYQVGAKEEDLAASSSDSAAFMPKSVVIDPSFDWGGDAPLRIPFHQTILYEMHVKGFTMRRPDVPPELRGTYAGLAHPPVLDYLSQLGVTAVELMPVHQFVNDRHLVDRGLTNYWGYNSIGFFAPDVRYSKGGTCGQQVVEFKQMVKAFHQAGIEVILDVVYNHTGEGNHMGPTLCFRGIDNDSYYRLMPDRRFYQDFTGTGNTLNMMQPNVLQLIMDSLRYWIQDMHVDGFRFDLASTLARESHAVDPFGAFFDIIRQDPVISQVKLIAEPWDLGEGGYQVGRFPPGWAEWNGMYRDTVRDFWRGVDSTLAEFASRFTGSADLYYASGRRMTASINFITAHDGFTLNDLVSYNDKHNEANGEDNRDGESHNRSWNCGVEGPTDRRAVLKLRGRLQRNFIATLLLSQGVPMLLGGDEIGRTQQGNNNAYCQDNEITWFDWDNADRDLLKFTRDLIRLRRENPVFRQRHWFEGKPVRKGEAQDIAWFNQEGTEMNEAAWKEGYAKSLQVYLNGGAIRSPDPQGNPISGSSFLILFNAHYGDLTFTLPGVEFGRCWEMVVDTSRKSFKPGQQVQPAGQVKVNARSLVVFRHLD